MDYLYTHAVLEPEEREKLEEQQAAWEKEGNSIPSQDYPSESYPSQNSRPQEPSYSSEGGWESSQEEQQEDIWPPKDTWPPEDGGDDGFSSDAGYMANPEGTL